jgi:hypothetical protein
MVLSIFLVLGLLYGRHGSPAPQVSRNGLSSKTNQVRSSRERERDVDQISHGSMEDLSDGDPYRRQRTSLGVRAPAAATNKRLGRSLTALPSRPCVCVYVLLFFFLLYVCVLISALVVLQIAHPPPLANEPPLLLTQALMLHEEHQNPHPRPHIVALLAPSPAALCQLSLKRRTLSLPPPLTKGLLHLFERGQ